MGKSEDFMFKHELLTIFLLSLFSTLSVFISKLFGASYTDSSIYAGLTFLMLLTFFSYKKIERKINGI